MPLPIAVALCAASLTLAQPSAPTPPSPPTPPTPPPAVAPLTDPSVSPFEAVEWEPGQLSIARVKVGGEWFALLEINGWKIRELLRFARQQYGDKAAQRFEEDLPQLLTDAGRPPARRVTLRLRTQVADVDLHVEVEMTSENRRALREARRQRPRDGAPVDDALVATAALREFRDLVATRHAYSIATDEGARLAAIVDDVLNRPERPTIELAALTIEQALAASRDGHAGIDGDDVTPHLRSFVMPCLLVPLGDEPASGVVALKPDRSGLLDPQHPYIINIGSLGIEERLAGASQRVARGSPALVRERSCRELRWLGVIAARDVPLTLASTPTGDGGRAEVVVQTASAAPRYGEWPRRESGWLNETVGYIRLGQMSSDPALLRKIEDLASSFDRATGLVIDVRGNGGGSRDALMMLASRLMAPGAEPIVFNAVRPLTFDEPGGHVDRRMDSRFLRRADDPRWNGAERAAITRFSASFKPDAPGVNLDGGAFGPWYYGVLKPDPGSTWHRPHRRVVVLMDNVCFSATDVFLAAMKEIDGVTLVGRPSAGGSGMAIDYPLAGERIAVSLSSMVSFQPDGKLFDGVGVRPDVHVTPRPTDFITGGTDTTLDRAIELLSSPR